MPARGSSVLLPSSGGSVPGAVSLPFLLGWILAWFAAGVSGPRIVAGEFSRHIRPVLAENCFRCHGPDAASRKGGLRLDTREGALAGGRSGRPALSPGMPQASLLLDRVTSPDPAERMPPAEAHGPLGPEAVAMLRRWIADGAPYEPHWAFVPPARPPLPPGDAPTPIDAFIRAALVREGLQPAPEADRRVLIRRLHLDLTGLPPRPEDVEAFAADPDPSAYARLVDRLLASPAYGERMAADWLDAARYADTNGYQVDRDREVWAWRDWVIGAFNANMRFDQFTREQLAGDLIAGATVAQRIATGFGRNHMINEEGGVIPSEFLAEYCADRVETVGTVWLGLTLNCARCHDHKHDPVSQRDFYGLYAFFHNVAEQGIGDYGAPSARSSPPYLRLPTEADEARLAGLGLSLKVAQQALADHDAGLVAALPSWEAGLGAEKLPEEVALVLKQPSATRSEAARAKVVAHRLSLDPERKRLAAQVEEFQKRMKAAELAVPVTLVMEELEKPRETFVLRRGQYDQPGEKAGPATPAFLPPMERTWPRNRLGLAEWLTARANPLTARVVVNRIWQSLFGTGLVRTPGDFGLQGDLPSHPELLDWLAVEFQDAGWDLKALVRQIVLSGVYRQDSRAVAGGRALDPENRWLARAPRFRLPAEMIRDQALALAGLLNARVGGPSVKPYHPPGLYEQVVAGSSASTYLQDGGEALHRRTLYTYWKRSVPNPGLLVFDMPFRETCVVRRSRTSTPLQALNLMNDPTYVEAARVLAERMLRDGGSTGGARVRAGFRWVTGRPPTEVEAGILDRALARATAGFSTDPSGAREWIAVGATPPRGSADPVAHAAYGMVASILLNLDEVVHRE